MNLGLDWIPVLTGAELPAVHWRDVGAQDEADETIVRWARDHDHVVLTADLDFGMHVVRRGDAGPSVVQLRTAETLAALVGSKVLSAFDLARDAILAGAIVTVEDERIRIRRLMTSSIS